MSNSTVETPNNNNNNSKFIGQIATYEIIKLLQIAQLFILNT